MEPGVYTTGTGLCKCREVPKVQGNVMQPFHTGSRDEPNKNLDMGNNNGTCIQIPLCLCGEFKLVNIG